MPESAVATKKEKGKTAETGEILKRAKEKTKRLGLDLGEKSLEDFLEYERQIENVVAELEKVSGGIDDRVDSLHLSDEKNFSSEWSEKLKNNLKEAVGEVIKFCDAGHDDYEDQRFYHRMKDAANPYRQEDDDLRKEDLASLQKYISESFYHPEHDSEKDPSLKEMYERRSVLIRAHIAMQELIIDFNRKGRVFHNTEWEKKITDDVESYKKIRQDMESELNKIREIEVKKEAENQAILDKIKALFLGIEKEALQILARVKMEKDE